MRTLELSAWALLTGVTVSTLNELVSMPASGGALVAGMSIIAARAVTAPEDLEPAR